MSDHDSEPVRTRRPAAVLIGVLGSLLVGLVVLAFVWPSATARPHDLPVGVSGPAAQVSALKTQLEDAGNPFDLVAVDSRSDAVHRIEHRTIYGAILLGDSPEILTSSAASTASNQALRGVGTALQQRIATTVEQALVAKLQQAGSGVAGLQKQVAALQKTLQAVRSGQLPADRIPAAPQPGAGQPPGSSASASAALPTVRITDVVALSSDDPNGAGLAGASFPLVLGGMLGGVLVSLLVAGTWRRVLALLVYGVSAGAVVTLVLQTWLHVLQQSWLLNAGAFGLAMAATASVVVGFSSLLGQPGIGVGAAISLLIGNPISGATLPYQFLPAPWGAIGQYFVPGAASNLVRSLSYFPHADTSMQWLVLAAWTLGGLVLTVAGHFRAAAMVREPAWDAERRTTAT